MGILDGIVEWIAEQVMAGLDLVTTSVLGALGCDMAVFLRYFPAAETAVRSTAPGKSNDGCYSKGVGCCQFADWIYSHFVLRIVFKHYFYHSILLGSCI